MSGKVISENFIYSLSQRDRENKRWGKCSLVALSIPSPFQGEGKKTEATCG